MVLDPSKTNAVLDDFADLFLHLLDCMDREDGPGLEAILLGDMAPEDDFTNKVLDLVRGGDVEPRPERGYCQWCEQCTKGLEFVPRVRA